MAVRLVRESLELSERRPALDSLVRFLDPVLLLEVRGEARQLRQLRARERALLGAVRLMTVRYTMA